MAGWLEPRTKVPFTGIVAMVCIVAVVAVFLHSSLAPLLPGSDVRVDSSAEQNVRGSASFRGERDIPLTYDELLEGVLVIDGTSILFLVDMSDRMLVLTHSGLREEVVMESTKDNLGLTARFEFEGAEVTTTVYPSERSLFWQKTGKLGTEAQLADVVRYSGVFLFDGDQYEVEVDLGQPDARITRRGVASVVPLTARSNELAGTWRSSDGSTHPVAVNFDTLLMTISNLW